MITIEYSQNAIESLKSFDKQTKTLIIHWIEKNFSNTLDPSCGGKPLAGKNADYWWFRLGHFRIIAKISNKMVEIISIRMTQREEARENDI
jgi:mRNA-degrading endonuclease RelE of RelBE toxin-antitoxin system